MKTLIKNMLFYWEDDIYRILAVASGTKAASEASASSETADNEILIINCNKRNMPQWVKISGLRKYSLCSEEELLRALPLRAECELSEQELLIAQTRYHIICGILSFLQDEKIRTKMIKGIAEANKISVKTVRNYLCLYLVYQQIASLAPKLITEKRELTQDQKNIRWALNKFYYTRHRNTLADAYVMMLKEKYTDIQGNLLEGYPSIHQFRYFYRQNKSLQKQYISRDGIKNYEMNHRPLLGDGVQEFAQFAGFGMLDATICDIYLCDEGGSLIGRPVLVACVDAYSGMICGYSLLWEGGMYSIRELLLNCIADKVEWCARFGILIQKEEWDCNQLPGIFVTDMGSEFKSYNMEQVSELGCSVINLPSFRAELKGPVEQIFHAAQNLYKPYLKGKGVIEPDFQKRGVRDYRKDACLTMEQFEQIIIRCILYYNNNRVVEKFPYTEEMLKEQIPPHAASIWNYAKNQAGANLLDVTEKKLILTMLPRTEGRFGRNGLRVNKLRYKADGYTEEYLTGDKVIVAYNPEDSSVVYLVRDNYKQFQLIESRFADKTVKQVHDIKSQQRELERNCVEESIQAILKQSQDTDLESIFSVEKAIPFM